MAEWLFEEGIGENRAALIEDGAIIEAHLEPHNFAAQAGMICEAKLVEILPNKRTGRIELESGEEALIDPIPTGISEGASSLVEIIRSAIPEPGRRKRALARSVEKGRSVQSAPTLRNRLTTTDVPVRTINGHDRDALGTSGWIELLEQAATGAVLFSGGALRIALTPAMTVIDVDGALPPAELAIAGARSAGAAIRKFDIGGSTVIDLPSLSAKSDRQAAVEALDDALPRPFERTAVNGFGLLQVVRRRTRPSLLETVQYESAATAARALLRTGERTAGSGDRTLAAHPAVITQLHEHPDWLETLERRIGASVITQVDPALGLWSGHASAAQPS